jgi:hypothetical protein
MGKDGVDQPSPVIHSYQAHRQYPARTQPAALADDRFCSLSHGASNRVCHGPGPAPCCGCLQRHVCNHSNLFQCALALRGAQESAPGQKCRSACRQSHQQSIPVRTCVVCCRIRPGPDLCPGKHCLESLASLVFRLPRSKAALAAGCLTLVLYPALPGNMTQGVK